jgi:hypothetical protein
MNKFKHISLLINKNTKNLNKDEKITIYCFNY